MDAVKTKGKQIMDAVKTSGTEPATAAPKISQAEKAYKAVEKAKVEVEAFSAFRISQGLSNTRSKGIAKELHEMGKILQKYVGN